MSMVSGLPTILTTFHYHQLPNPHLTMPLDDLLFKAKKLTSFQRPSHRDYKSVRTWFYNEEPLVRREQAYIECKEDLVTLRNGRECAGFDGWVEGLVRMLDCRFTRVSQSTAFGLEREFECANVYLLCCSGSF
jgi:hypothetical protein